MRRTTLFLASVIFLSSAVAAPVRADDVLEPGAGIKKIAGDCKFTEGPAVDAQGNLFFSDGPNDRIMKRAPDGSVSVFRQPCGRVNGMTFDGEGRLVMCQSGSAGGLRRVVRLEKNGDETVLCERFEGKRFSAPNDLCIDPRGRIYFTDINPMTAGDETTLGSAVYRIDAPSKVVRVIDNLEKPNGIVITPDGKTLYVSDRGKQKLHRYAVQEDGSLKADGIAYDFSPDRGIDGMRLDVQGNIYGTAGQGATTGLFVISPQGKLLLHQPMPEFSTNLAFGGADNRDLYFTASTSVYLLRTVVPGAPVGQRSAK